MTSHFLPSRWGRSLRAICSFVDVRVFICRLLGLWLPVVSVVAAGIWLGSWGRSFWAGTRGHSLRICERFARLSTYKCSFVDVCDCGALLFLWWQRAFGSKWRVGCLYLPAVFLRCAHSVKCPVKCLVSIWFAVGGLFCPRCSWPPTLLVSSN